MTAGGRPCGRCVVLVCGPPFAGVTAVADALRGGQAVVDHPDHHVVEPVDLRPGDAPVAVVFVVSAAARLAGSDCAILDHLLHAVAASPERVIGVVSKIDVHRGWRGTVAANRDRYAGLAWVGVAAAPVLGGPQMDRLVELLSARLSEQRTILPNNIIRVVAAQARKPAANVNAALLRSRTQQARVQLGALARRRCAGARAELADAATTLTRHNRRLFPGRVRARLEHAAAEVDDAVTEYLAIVAAELGLPDEVSPPMIELPVPADPTAASGGLESRLTMLLGAGFGLGVSLTMGRLVAELAPGYAMAAGIAGLLAGAVLAVWVVAARRLLGERIAMQRWAADAVDALRGAADEAVALRVVTVERFWSTAIPQAGPSASQSESLYSRT